MTTTKLRGKPMHCKDDRIDIANFVLKCFAPETTLRIESGYVLVAWTDSRGKHEKRWMTRGQDFYPGWHNNWGHGGTASTALSQLVRWVKCLPVLPLSTWQYWSGDRVQLLRQGNAEMAIQTLMGAGYPQKAECVLCGDTITGGMDWWSLNGVTGPCCGMRSGCQQKGTR